MVEEGKPAPDFELTSDSGEIPYVVQDAAVVVGEKDVEKWTEELGRLLENPSLRSKFSLIAVFISSEKICVLPCRVKTSRMSTASTCASARPPMRSSSLR